MTPSLPSFIRAFKSIAGRQQSWWTNSSKQRVVRASKGLLESLSQPKPLARRQQDAMEQRLHMDGILLVQFDAFSLLEFAVDWQFVPSAFRLEKAP